MSQKSKNKNFSIIISRTLPAEQQIFSTFFVLATLITSGLAKIPLYDKFIGHNHLRKENASGSSAHDPVHY